MKKILFSVGLIGFVAAAAWGATGAFFSDSETSVGNTLAAGAIDLKIDNESYVTSTTTGLLVANPNTSWTIRDLTVEKFFDFEDVKPGDIGEDTISLHVDNNDAYLCADITLTSNNENNLVEPEAEDGDVTSGPNGGELAQQVNFAWWADDGDNVLEVGENLLPGGPLGALAIGATTTVTLADSQSNIWTGRGGPIPGASTRYVGKAWCFGTITPSSVAQDNATTSGPLIRGTGFVCDGTSTNNTAQTDSLTADVSFRAIQSRNNGNFVCGGATTTPPVEPAEIIVNSDDLATTTGAVAQNPTKWFFYNDTNDTVMTINEFSGTGGVNDIVAGPLAVGAAQMTLDSGVNPRYNIATVKYGNVKLSDIGSLNYRIYDASASSETPYLHFNVDFTGSDIWQSRLVQVPTGVTEDTWTTVNALTGNWTYSGAFWPVGGSELGTTPGTTAKTWASILADYPNIETLSTGAFFGVRVGHPGPNGEEGYVDWVEFDGETTDFE